jgi:hypothetical protein
MVVRNLASKGVSITKDQFDILQLLIDDVGEFIQKPSEMDKIVNIQANQVFSPKVAKGIQDLAMDAGTLIQGPDGQTSTYVHMISNIPAPSNTTPIVESTAVAKEVKTPTVESTPNAEKPTIVEKPTIAEKPTVVEKPTVAEKPTIVEKPTIMEKPTVAETVSAPIMTKSGAWARVPAPKVVSLKPIQTDAVSLKPADSKSNAQPSMVTKYVPKSRIDTRDLFNKKDKTLMGELANAIRTRPQISKPTA